MKTDISEQLEGSAGCVRHRAPARHGPKPAARGRRPAAHPWRLLLCCALLVLASCPPALIVGTDLLGWGDLTRLFQPRPGIQQAVLETLRLPRLLVAILIGAALGTAGALMQSVLRNSLAAPDIVGVTSAAQLALVANHLLFSAAVPDLAATSLGGLAGCLLSLAVAGGGRVAPARLALAGVAVSLGLGALSSAIVLFADDRASGLVLWSAGFLDQTGWDRLRQVAPGLGLGLVLALLLARSLDIASLGEETAGNLGLGRAVPFLSLGVAVLLSGAAVSLAGPIGFVGLAAPNLARMAVGSRHRHVLPLSAVGGVLVLLWADIAAQALSANGALPTGALVACVGAPAMLFLVLRMRGGARQGGGDRALSPRALLPPARLAALLLALLLCAGLAGLAAGDGWAFANGPFLDTAAMRLPRLLAAAGAGALLGLAGTLLQTLTRNPLAGPETLGILQGAALFSLVAIGFGTVPGSLGFVMATTAGGGVVVLVLAALKAERDPLKLVLCGVALAAGFGALSTLFVVNAQFQMTEALSWLAGSTHGRSLAQAAVPIPFAAILLLVLWLARRSFDVLAQGDETARSLGLAVPATRRLALGAATLATGLAVSTVGAVGFIGLLAPHAVRMLGGSRHGILLPAAMGMGAAVAMLADAVGRAVLAPYEVPVGIVTALVGVPLFLGILRRSSR